MKRSIAAAAFGVVAVAVVLAAQSPDPFGTPRPIATPLALAQDPTVAALRGQWRAVTANIAKSAQQLNEAEYEYRPVGTVRTFGQLIAHVAGSQHEICAAALGEKGRAENEFENALKAGKLKRAGLIAALDSSTKYCERAYAQSGIDGARSTTLFGSTATRLDALALNAVHNGEHYGNIITYMRMQGKVPPSSQR